MFGMTNPRLSGPKRTFKFSLYKLMAMRAASYVCELRPALNVPIVFTGQREMEYRSPLLCMWAKRVVARRVMERSDAVLVASRYYNGSG